MSALFREMGGQISAIELVDTGSEQVTQVGIRFINRDGDTADAESLVFDLNGVRLELDGSFPRDVSRIHDWAESGYSVRTFIESEASFVDAVRLIAPGERLLELDSGGLRVSLPYSTDTDPVGEGQERVFRAEISGDFSPIVGTRFPWPEPLTDDQLSQTTVTGVSFRDLVIDTASGSETVDQELGLEVSEQSWTLAVNELRFILEGQIGDTLLDLDQVQGLDASEGGSLFDRTEALRLTTLPLIESGSDDLLRMVKLDGPELVGGLRVRPGDEVQDWSGSDTPVSEVAFDGQHLIGTGHDDTVVTGDISSDHVIDGGPGDDHLGSSEVRDRGATFVGGDGADTFHLTVSPGLAAPYHLPDFDPSAGDLIDVIPTDTTGAGWFTDPLEGLDTGRLDYPSLPTREVSDRPRPMRMAGRVRST